MTEIAVLQAARADLERRQRAVRFCATAARTGGPTLRICEDHLDIFCPHGALRRAEFGTNTDETDEMVAHLSKVVKPGVPSTWTSNRTRRADGTWCQSYWLMLQGHERIEGRAEHSEKMRAVHAAYLDLLHKAIELQVVQIDGRIYRLREHAGTKASRALFDEQMRLREEHVATVARQRAQRAARDAEWVHAAP